MEHPDRRTEEWWKEELQRRREREERENQRLASDLSSDLSSRFAQAGYEATLAVAEHHLHLDCTAARGVRSCCIHCLYGRPGYTGFAVDFQQGGVSAAVGRTPLKSAAGTATTEWLGGLSLSSLRRRFVFVDREKRAGEAVKAQVTQSFPRLGDVDSSASYAWYWESGSHLLGWLLFRAKDRQCYVHFEPFSEPFSKAIGKGYALSFCWDETELFGVSTEDTSLLGRLIGRWLCDRNLPSAMRAELPGAYYNGQLAEHYEAGWNLEEALADDFVASWDLVQDMWEGRGNYAGNTPKPTEQILFLRASRQAGYDRRLRAGTQLGTFIVSRAKNVGLGDEQHQIRFRFANGLQISGHLDGDFEITLPEIAFTPEVDRLLRQLAEYDFD